MKISNLPSSDAFESGDVLAIEISGKTYKVTGATLAAALEEVGRYVTVNDMATTTVDGLMSAADKNKLDGIAAGAQVNSVTGVKGNAEDSYRSGNVNLTPSNIGSLPDSTTAADIGAMLNLSITNADVANATSLYNKLSQIPYSTEPSVRGAAAGYIGQTPMRTITGISTASYGWGYIIRNGVNDFRFFVATSTGGVCYAFALTASESDYSCGTVYKYTGE